MIDLSLVKQHLNIMDDFYDDDAYISSLVESAESALETELNINMCDLTHRQFELFKLCVLQLVATAYTYREGTILTFNLNVSNVFNYLKGLIHNYTLNSFG
jgi:hypothetical protein